MIRRSAVQWGWRWRPQTITNAAIPHRCLVLGTALAALLFAAPASARTAGPGSPRPGLAAATRSRSGLVPVWAYLNGAYPVVGGRVLIMAGGRPVRQVGGRVSTRTNANGVAVLSVGRVPRRFSVVVRGGRAAGRRLTGSLRSLAGSDPVAGVVEVNPLTTLVTQLRRLRPRLGYGHASRAVKRYFGVPWWADLGQDLRAGPRWFNARAYVRAVGRYGSIDGLDRALARRILRGESGTRPTSGTASFRTATETRKVTPAGLQDASPELVGKVFGILLKSGLLGGFLAVAKGGEPALPRTEFDAMRKQLEALGAQLTRLDGNVAELSKTLAHSDASRLLHQSDDIVGRIDHAQAQLALLANLAPTDPTRQKFAETITAYIGANLLDAPARLNRQLSPSVGIGDNAIKATSRALAASVRFFDPRQSNQVRALYDYFATYQAQLAVLLTNYWTANPDTYSLATRQASIAQIDANVTKIQKESLKPTVPTGTFFDMRTPKFMWGMYQHGVNALRLLDLLGSRTLELGSFSNYQLPSLNDLRNLVAGATGDPRAWLQAQVEVPLSHAHLWYDQSVSRSDTSAHRRIYVYAFDFATGRDGSVGDYNLSCILRANGIYPCSDRSAVIAAENRFLESKYAGLLMLRYLAPGESYWW